jgi:hypothetical protein
LFDENSNSLNVSELRIAAGKALAFQRYIFKKAWALYYSVWAATFAIYFILPIVFGAIGLSSNLTSNYALLAIDLAVSIAAGATSGRIIERARNAAFVQNAMRATPSIFEKKNKLFAAWWIIYFATIVGFAIFSGGHLLSIVFGLATTGSIVFYYALRASFQERLPLEGIVAISVFGLAATASFAISLFSENSIFYVVIWSITIVVWFAASLFSLLHAKKDLAKFRELTR